MIRHAAKEDVEKIMIIIDIAREYMRSSGNAVQWVNGYPSRETVENDIENGVGYVRDTDGTVDAYFAFIKGADPTYAVIEEGEWLNDEPYGTIHRMASDGTKSGIMSDALEYCFREVENVRADTHELNSKMRYILTKHGFSVCGRIYIADGTPRIAFHKIMRKNK